MKSVIFILFLLLIPAARAGFNLEPYIGYMTGSSDMTSAGTTVEWSYKAPIIGGRVGFGTMGFSMGVDYSRSLVSYDYEQDTPAISGFDEVTKSDFGVYAGYKFPVMFRLWGTYFFDTKFEVDTKGAGTASVVATAREGTGWGVGVGFTGLPFVSINLEYRMLTFDENLPTGSTSDLEAKELLLSVSLPFEFN